MNISNNFGFGEWSINLVETVALQEINSNYKY